MVNPRREATLTAAFDDPFDDVEIWISELARQIPRRVLAVNTS